MRRSFWIYPIALGVGALIAGVVILLVNPFSDGSSGGNDTADPAEGPLGQALRRMVLKLEDLSGQFAPGEQSFSDNKEAAAGGSEREALLHEWGRVLGYDVTYVSATQEQDVRGINVSASLYQTEDGASASFADAVKTAEETDWAANYAGLGDFQQETLEPTDLADEIVWLRFTGFQPASSGPSPLVSDYLIFFRVGTERGFLRVLGSSVDTDDRGHLDDTVESWLQTLLQKVKDALAEGDFDLEEGEQP